MSLLLTQVKAYVSCSIDDFFVLVFLIIFERGKKLGKRVTFILTVFAGDILLTLLLWFWFIFTWSLQTCLLIGATDIVVHLTPEQKKSFS